MATPTLTATTVSEYLTAGGFMTGYTLLERPAQETPKALAFRGVGTSRYGFPDLNAYGWFPKKLAVKLRNDFYTEDAPAEMYAFPNWLLAAKKAEGWEIA